MKQGDFGGSLDATSEGLQASDFSKAIVAGLDAVISWESATMMIRELGSYKSDNPPIIAPLRRLLQSFLNSVIPSHLPS